MINSIKIIVNIILFKLLYFFFNNLLFDFLSVGYKIRLMVVKNMFVNFINVYVKEKLENILG